MPATANIGYQNATDIVIDMATNVPDGATETFAISATRAFKVVGVSCIAEVTAAGSSVEVRKGGTVIITGLAMVTANTVTGAGTLVATALDFAVGDTLNVAVTSGAGVTARGVIIIRTEPTPTGDSKVVTAV